MLELLEVLEAYTAQALRRSSNKKEWWKCWKIKKKVFMSPLQQAQAIGLDVRPGKDGKIDVAGLDDLAPETAGDVRAYILEHKQAILAELLGDKLCGSDRPGLADDSFGRRCHYNCEHREALPDMCWWVWRCGKTGQRTHSTAMCGYVR